MTIRAPKDFWSGIMFLAFAAVALLTARGYSLGTAGRMGPGYFPMLLGGVLGGLGLVLVARSLCDRRASGVGRLQVAAACHRTCAACACSASRSSALGLLVSLAGRRCGLTALASRESRPLEFVALALVLAAFSVGVFVYALRLPLPLWPAL